MAYGAFYTASETLAPPGHRAFWQLSNVEPCGFTFYAVGGMVVVSGRRLRDRDQINISAISMLANSLLLVAIWVALGICAWVGWGWEDGLRRFLYGERDARAPRAPCFLAIIHCSLFHYQLFIIHYQHFAVAFRTIMNVFIKELRLFLVPLVHDLAWGSTV